jgi:hypothetical protein
MADNTIQIGDMIFKTGDKISKIEKPIVYPNNIRLPPFSKLVLYNDDNFRGDNISIHNNNEMSINIDARDVKNNKIKFVKSISIVPVAIEGFSENSVRDVCLYTCSNFNYMNLVLCTVLTVILYYYFYYL